MKLCVLVNDTPYGVMGLRACNLTAPLTSRYRIDIAYREAGKFAEMRRFMRIIRDTRPDLVYVMNVGYAGGGAALLARTCYGIPYMLDHGDPSYELLKTSGRPLYEYWLVRIAEWTMLRAASAVIARGAALTEELRRQGVGHVHFIPDGVDLSVFTPMDVAGLRRAHGLDGALTLGVVGSLVWSERYRMCYGWDILEAVKRLRDRNVTGIIVGDGTGLPRLKQRAQEYGIADRIWFTGRVPHAEVPRYINMMDVCISTQTNDPVGQSRTTAKLPEYLACGRFIIATDVGGARDLIRENGFLLPYKGIYDPEHPARLAERVAWLLDHRDALARGAQGVEIARRHFEYACLAARLDGIIAQVCNR